MFRTSEDEADKQIIVLTKILLDKQFHYKEEKEILCDKKYTQVGIANKIFDDQNMFL